MPPRTTSCMIGCASYSFIGAEASRVRGAARHRCARRRQARPSHAPPLDPPTVSPLCSRNASPASPDAQQPDAPIPPRRRPGGRGPRWRTISRKQDAASRSTRWTSLRSLRSTPPEISLAESRRDEDSSGRDRESSRRSLTRRRCQPTAVIGHLADDREMLRSQDAGSGEPSSLRAPLAELVDSPAGLWRLKDAPWLKPTPPSSFVFRTRSLWNARFLRRT
jgi:hypothetical protein